MALKAIFIGDIYGKPGRKAVAHFLPKIKEEEKIDLIIANGENVTHGKGLSKKHYDYLKSLGIDVFTMGNHYLDDKNILEWVDEADIVRPANIVRCPNGKKSIVVNTVKGSVRISNILGQIFIKKFEKESPFDALESIINKSSEKIHIVDIHAEATSEKKAIAYHFLDKISAFVGTHTHIQTADERILNDTTGYISDAGFCGSYDSVLGVNIKGAINLTKDGILKDLSPGKSDKVEFNAVLMEFDTKSGKCINIKRINKKATL